MWKRFWRRVVNALRRDFIAGLLVFVPVGFTILAVLWILDQLDRLVLPRAFAALGLEAKQPPLVGVVATLLVILGAGWLTRSFVGRGALRWWERFVEQIPVARSFYTVLKQFMQTVFESGDGEQGFSSVVLIEYPRRGIYSYAFVTGRMSRAPDGEVMPYVKVFVPSTPNPTTGYYLLLPEDETIETGLGVEEAFKMIVSAGIAETTLGVVEPPEAARAQPVAKRGSSP